MPPYGHIKIHQGVSHGQPFPYRTQGTKAIYYPLVLLQQRIMGGFELGLGHFVTTAPGWYLMESSDTQGSLVISTRR
jgi:hypothetical protein